MDKVKYLPHPCSKAKKREWNEKGYRVLDIRFAPEGLEQDKPKRKARAKKED